MDMSVCSRLQDIYRFLRNGCGVFSFASKGTYRSSLESVQAIRHELMEEPILADHKKRCSDYKTVSRDLNQAWNTMHR